MRSETLNWVGGEHEFALTLPLLDALQQRCGGDGVGLIYKRLVSQEFRTTDVVATLALGLEGGGMAKHDAVRLVHNQYEDHGLFALVLPALGVLGGALQGWPEDEGKPTGEAPANP
jgi:hypothetical protein